MGFDIVDEQSSSTIPIILRKKDLQEFINGALDEFRTSSLLQEQWLPQDVILFAMNLKIKRDLSNVEELTMKKMKSAISRSKFGRSKDAYTENPTGLLARKWGQRVYYFLSEDGLGASFSPANVQEYNTKSEEIINAMNRKRLSLERQSDRNQSRVQKRQRTQKVLLKHVPPAAVAFSVERRSASAEVQNFGVWHDIKTRKLVGSIDRDTDA